MKKKHHLASSRVPKYAIKFYQYYFVWTEIEHFIVDREWTLSQALASKWNLFFIFSATISPDVFIFAFLYRYHQQFHTSTKKARHLSTAHLNSKHFFLRTQKKKLNRSMFYWIKFISYHICISTFFWNFFFRLELHTFSRFIHFWLLFFF